MANYPTASLSNPLFWMLDERNSLIALTNLGGATPYTNAYDEYGNPRPGNLGRFQYTGQLLMPDFAAYHYKARAYAPGLGRFLQTDPIGYAAGANLYGYVGADPVNFSDPLGLYPCAHYGPNPDNPSEALCIGPVLGGPPITAFASWGFGSWGAVGSGGGNPYAGYFGGSLSESMGPPIQSDPQNAPFQAAYQQASRDNAWMIIPVIAPAAVIGGIEVGAAFGARSLFQAVCSKCFVADTPVHTSEGLKAIQDIEVGDLVLSRDEVTEETALKPVLALIKGTERAIWEVTVETVDAEGAARRETIGTTFDHPWRLVGGDWRETAELEPGDQLVAADGRRAIVVSATPTERVEMTYNFEVEAFHTYFVGESEVWVHNACPARPPVIRCTNCGSPHAGGIYKPFDSKLCPECFFKKWTFWPWER